jgi:hypothetical protein
MRTCALAHGLWTGCQCPVVQSGGERGCTSNAGHYFKQPSAESLTTLPCDPSLRPFLATLPCDPSLRPFLATLPCDPSLRPCLAKGRLRPVLSGTLRKQHHNGPWEGHWIHARRAGTLDIQGHWIHARRAGTLDIQGHWIHARRAGTLDIQGHWIHARRANRATSTLARGCVAD